MLANVQRTQQAGSGEGLDCIVGDMSRKCATGSMYGAQSSEHASTQGDGKSGYTHHSAVGVTVDSGAYMKSKFKNKYNSPCKVGHLFDRVKLFDIYIADGEDMGAQAGGCAFCYLGTCRAHPEGEINAYIQTKLKKLDLNKRIVRKRLINRREIIEKLKMNEYMKEGGIVQEVWERTREIREAMEVWEQHYLNSFEEMH